MAFWRGTWDYANIWYDDFIFKKDYDLSNGVALLLGLLLNFLLDMFHHCVKPLAGEVRRTNIKKTNNCDKVEWSGVFKRKVKGIISCVSGGILAN